MTSSARGEVFNPLLWPFLLSTLTYGVGFAFGLGSADSSLHMSLAGVWPLLPIVWGVAALAVIVGGITFLLFNLPPYGKLSGLVGFMLWLCGAIAYGLSGSWLLLLAVAVPNMWFWIWQYLSLSVFRGQEELDAKTMRVYNAGGYDDDNGGKELREANRGVDRQ